MAKNKPEAPQTDAAPAADAEAPKAPDNSIDVTSKKTGRSVTFIRDFGKDLDASIQAFGAEVVHSNFLGMVTIKAQAAARGILNNSVKSPDDAIKAGEGYTPGIVRRGGGGKKKDPMDVLADRVKSGKASAEELMAELQKRIAAANDSGE